MLVGPVMNEKDVVLLYLEGFRLGDASKVLSCLSEDVEWRLHGCRTYRGKAAFAQNIVNDEFVALDRLDLQRLIQEGARVVAVGVGAVSSRSTPSRYFSFCEVFLIEDGVIREVDTFHVWTQEGECKCE